MTLKDDIVNRSGIPADKLVVIPVGTAPIDLTQLSIRELALRIRRDWKKVNYAAVPYLDAMTQLDKITDKYFEDDGRSIVGYFLCNAKTWKGETAKAIKAELKRRVK